MQSSELETGSLILCPLQLEDAVQTQRLFPYWDIVKFLSSTVPWPYPADGVFQFLQKRCDSRHQVLFNAAEWKQARL
jgi:hypothetical protein